MLESIMYFNTLDSIEWQVTQTCVQGEKYHCRHTPHMAGTTDLPERQILSVHLDCAEALYLLLSHTREEGSLSPMGNHQVHTAHAVLYAPFGL